MLIALGASAALIVLVIIALIVALGRGKDVQANAPSPTLEPTVSASPSATPVPTATPEPTPGPTVNVTNESRAALRPTAKPGLLPIFQKANTTEKIIAITVDDCFQANNLRDIVNSALSVGGRLTIFPIGDQVVRDETHKEAMRYAYASGMEMENHTYTHNGLYTCGNEELAWEIYAQNVALSEVLGVEYTVHFLRPRGGDANACQRLHSYAKQMGYKGIAHWSQSGSGSTIQELKANLEPGEIYLFHTTNADREKLLEFIPYAVQQGYQLVTLNEMFGYPENETSELTLTLAEREVPPLEPYETVLVPYRKNSYAWGVNVMQQRLKELGYLDSVADGIYGNDTVIAIQKFQYMMGLETNGNASVDLQKLLYSDEAVECPAVSPTAPPAN